MKLRYFVFAALLVAVPSLASAQPKPFKIGILNDQSTVYSNSQGMAR